MNRGTGQLMVAKNIEKTLFACLIFLIFFSFVPAGTPVVNAQYGIDYCKDRLKTDDINSCIATLHAQGIFYVDPIDLSSNSNEKCESGSSLDDALTLSYPNYKDEAAAALKFEEFIRSKRPNSPWLTIPNIGSRIVEEGKKYNANPFLMITIGKTESAFSTAGRAATVQNNPFGIKETSSTYVTFPTVEAGLFNEKGILAGLQKRLSEHPNYKDVKNMYEYYSVHVSGQILYPGDGFYSGDPAMPGAVVSSEGDTGYGPVEYWSNAINDYNEIFGSDLSTKPPQRNGLSISSDGTSCVGSYPAGEGGWDLPGEGPNPLAYFSQLYACDETPPADRSFAKTCDPAVGENAYGSGSYGNGTIEKCGCGPTSIATVASTVTGNKVTPTEVAQWSASNGGIDADGCGSAWFWETQEAQREFGITVTPITSSEFASTLRSGKIILVSLSAFPTPDSPVGHISVIRKVDQGGLFYFADTYSGAWGSETEEGASRMTFTEEQLAGMNKGAWAIGKL